jgi:hypothetical protein
VAGAAESDAGNADGDANALDVHVQDMELAIALSSYRSFQRLSDSHGLLRGQDTARNAARTYPHSSCRTANLLALARLRQRCEGKRRRAALVKRSHIGSDHRYA